MRSTCKVSVRKPDVKKPLERHRYGWNANIKIKFKEIELKGVDQINEVHDSDRCWTLMGKALRIWFS
jgi:hypothetical protein